MQKRPPKRRWKRVAGIAAIMLLLALALTAGLVYRAAQHVPEFYVQALERDPVVDRKQGDELERRVLDLHNQVQAGGEWEALFTEDQINGWLAVDLTEKFPNVLPSAVHEPRMIITPDEVKLACRYKTSQIDTVISLAATISMTDEPNVLAVRIHRARAGALPIPLAQFLDEITHAAHKGDIDVRWLQSEGDPVALVRLPTENMDLPDRQLFLEQFELRAGEAWLAGRTEWKSHLSRAAHQRPAPAVQ